MVLECAVAVGAAAAAEPQREEDGKEEGPLLPRMRPNFPSAQATSMLMPSTYPIPFSRPRAGDRR